ncbi:MAG: hypothetical protein MJ248_07090 [Bacilli bacterium]|nr:hypothetical protein [Bacilli bacterium]
MRHISKSLFCVSALLMCTGCSSKSLMSFSETKYINLGSKVSSVTINGKTIRNGDTSIRDYSITNVGSVNSIIKSNYKSNDGKKGYFEIAGFKNDTFQYFRKYTEVEKFHQAETGYQSYGMTPSISYVYDYNSKISSGYYFDGKNDYQSEYGMGGTSSDRTGKIQEVLDTRCKNFDRYAQEGSSGISIMNNGVACTVNCLTNKYPSSETIKVTTYKNFTKVKYHSDLGLLFNPDIDPFMTALYPGYLDFASKYKDDKSVYVNRTYYIENKTGLIYSYVEEANGLMFRSEDQKPSYLKTVFTKIPDSETKRFEKFGKDSYRFASNHFKNKEQFDIV